MVARWVRIGSWAVVTLLCVFLVYAMETYTPAKQALGQKNDGELTPVPKDVVQSLGDLSKYEKAAENGRLVLYVEPITSSIAVKDKNNGEVWMSASDVPDDLVGGSALLKNSVRSVFNFTYTDLKKPVHEVMASNSITGGPIVTTTRIEDGVKASYEFQKLGIRFAIEYTIDGDALEVYVPAEGIEESGSSVLVTLEPLPNLGSSGDQDEGYMFYPDGSGAITHFKQTHPQYRETYSAWVYGEEQPIMRKTDRRTENAFLPVFGVRRNGHGYVGFITEGEFDAKINFYPSGYRVNVNRVSSEYVYRRVYSGAIRRGDFAQRVEEKLLSKDRRTRYVFLNNETAHYSGMANVYRDYLLRVGKLRQPDQPLTGIPLALDLFMGIKEKRVLKDRFVRATTYREAIQIVEELRDSGIGLMDVILKGWMDKGYGHYPDSSKLSGALGSKSELERLAKLLDTGRSSLYLNFNLVDADDDNMGFSKQLDTVKTPNRLPVRNWGTRYILNAQKSAIFFEKKHFDRFSTYEGTAVDFERFGEYATADYNDWNRLNREESVMKTIGVMQKAKSASNNVAVHGGNLYVMSIADRLSDIPLHSTGYVFTDESVPFFPMIAHGSVPYSGSVPTNIHYDPEKQFLKSVEYGAMPYYELTYGEPENFRYTMYRYLFSSKFSLWKPAIVEQVIRLNDKLGHTGSEPIVLHRKRAADVYETTFADGTRVIVNYRNTEVTIDGHTVPPMDFVAEREGEAL